MSEACKHECPFRIIDFSFIMNLRVPTQVLKRLTFCFSIYKATMSDLDILKGSVSQISYLGPSFHCMSKNGHLYLMSTDCEFE